MLIFTTLPLLFVGASNDNFIFSDQSTTSNTYTDLATVGPTVTVNVGLRGCVLIFISAGIYGANTGGKYMNVQLSGANTTTVTDLEQALRSDAAAFANSNGTSGRFIFMSGLNPGITTFTCKYRTTGAVTANFFSRRLSVLPL